MHAWSRVQTRTAGCMKEKVAAGQCWTSSGLDDSPVWKTLLVACERTDNEPATLTVCLVGRIRRGGMGWTWDLGCLDGSQSRDRDIPPSIFSSDFLTPHPTFLHGRGRSLLSSRFFSPLTGSLTRFFLGKKARAGESSAATHPSPARDAGPQRLAAVWHQAARRRRDTGPHSGGAARAAGAPSHRSVPGGAPLVIPVPAPRSATTRDAT